MNARIIAPRARSTISNEMYNTYVKNLEAFVEDIIKDLRREAVAKYFKVINDEILSKMEEVNEYVEDKILAATYVNRSPDVIEAVIPQTLDRIKVDLCDFISQYWLLSKDNIVEIQNILKYLLNEFTKSAKEGIHDWFVTSIDSYLIPDVIKINHVTKVIKTIMTMYNNNILERYNIILPRCLRSAYYYLDLYTYYDDYEIVKKIGENYKIIKFKYEESEDEDEEESEDEDEE